ncbi:SNF2 family N-terminal domain-containing protein [Mycena amicta]|nr:SNF2 family N-terminal domain-containing protein [Mycena amicta]
MSTYHIVEYSKSSRAKCHGQICGRSSISTGLLRYGTRLTHTEWGESVGYWHWGCLTPAMISQLAISLPEQIEGFNLLKPADQAKIRLAMARGRVDPADMQIANPSLDPNVSTGQKRPRAALDDPQPTSSKQTVIDISEDDEDDVEPDEPLDELYTTLQSQVVGVQYYNGLVGPGEEVRLIREPLNQYDSYAIQVKNIGSTQVGHLPRAVSARLAPLLDAHLVTAEGIMLSGNLARRGSKIYSLDISLKIYGSPSRREILEPKLVWATPGQRGFPGSKGVPPVPTLKPPSRTAGPSNYPKSSQGPAQTEAIRRQAAEQEKANNLKAAVDSMEKVDDEKRRTGLLDQLMSAEDILNLPLCIAAPGIGNGLRVDLLKHQNQALQWALERESPILPKCTTDKPVQFWQFTAGGVYLNLATQTPQAAPPVLGRGAIFADAMGLGKTLTMLALILATKKDILKDFSNSTLVVAPLSVLSNWEKQIEDHCVLGALSFYVYYGPKRDITAAELQRYDVVITTYQVIASEHDEQAGGGHAKKKKKKIQSALFEIKWKRIVLDEAHTIRNAKTKAAKAAFNLHGQRRWALAATPIINSPKDLGSLLRFLRICQPLDDEDFFKRLILRKVKNGDVNGGKLLRILMTNNCLRRTKEMQDASGNPLIPLPPVEMIKVQVTLPPEARALYDKIEELSRNRVAAYMNSGNGMAQGQILGILTRMRQAVLHTALVPNNYLEQLRADDASDAPPEPKDKLQLQAKLNQAIEECEECPICFSELEDPRITSCGHVFCFSCISESLSRILQCPMDRGKLSLSDLHVVEAAPDSTQAPFREDSVGSDGSSAKIDQLIQLLQLSPSRDKSLVFSQFTSFLDKVADRLEEEGIEYVRFDGRMSAKRREETIAQFSVPVGDDELFAESADNDEDDSAFAKKRGKGKGKQKAKASSYRGTSRNAKVMLISLKAGALGLNLTVASNVYLMDPWWQEGIESQAIDRVNRIGQTKKVRVYQLIADDTVESKVLEIQERKKSMIQDAFSGLKHKETPRQKKEARLQELIALFNLEAAQIEE